MKICSLLLLAVVLTWQTHWLQATDSPQKAPKLASYLVDEDAISVSGISAGGYFAVQFHVAFSKTIMGAGILAAGPFWCAQDDVAIALSSCMVKPELISITELVAITYATALTGTIDYPSHLSSDQVFLFTGTLDTLVDPGVVKKLAQYYSGFITTGSLYMEDSIPAEHSMVTDDYGNSCGVFSAPFINNCNYSAALHLLQYIYRDITPANSSAAREENLFEFDQSEFFVDLPKLVSMDSTGFVYVPTACQKRARACRLHLAFHGCFQGRMFINSTFALHAGYNGLAEANDIIVLYPQVRNSTLNPKGCWDWWGYTAPAYASKLGPQMAGVKFMLDRILGSLQHV